MEIRYLEQDEKIKSRSLYEECFPEDTEEFVDYYYTEKCRDNAILAAMEGGEVISMIHLNPYTVSLFGRQERVHYIVAVATARRFRLRGIMRRMMERALADLKGEGEPFTFLMPANPDYYYSSGFVYWENQIQLVQDQGTIWQQGVQILPAHEEDCAALAAHANEVLAGSFDLWVRRDEAYYRRLIRELEAEDGKLLMLEQKGESGGTHLAGSIRMTRMGEVKIREPIMRDFCTESVRPVLMGRVLNPAYFCDMIKCTEKAEGNLSAFSAQIFSAMRIYINEVV